MFLAEEDLTLHITRGDAGEITVMAIDETTDGGETPYIFKAGEVLRLKVYEKKNCGVVVLQKDYPVVKDAETVTLALTEADTKIGDTISKPVDYWYEIELNPFTEPQTIVGYDEDGAKILRLYPEGLDKEYIPPTEEEIGAVDKELDLTSERAIQNQAVARAVVQLESTVEKNNETSTKLIAEINENVKTLDEQLIVERSRIANLTTIEEGSTTGDAEIIDARVGYDGKLYDSLGEAIRTQVGDVYACFEKGKNKINKIITGEAVSSNGVINANSTFQRTDYILLPAGTYVYSNHANAYTNFRYAVYGLDKTFELYRNGADNVVITLDDVKYVVISDSTNRQNLQLEEGNTATTYEPYSEKIKLDYLPIDELDIPIVEDEFNAESENALTNKAITKRLDGFLGAGKNLYNNAKRTNEIACRQNNTSGVQDAGSQADTENITGHAISDWIPVNENEMYVFSNSYSSNFNYRVHIVNENNILIIDYFDIGRASAFEIPAGAKKLRFSNRQEIMDTTQLEKGEVATDYEPYVELVKEENLPTAIQRNWFNGKTILFNGDSITIGTGLTPTTLAYPYLVCKELNAKIINNAIGGSTLASNPSNETRNPLILRYDTEVADEVAETVDLVYIAIGTNDWAYQYTPIGTMEDRVTTTFYGALHLLCQGLLNKYAGKPIVFATPIKRRVLEAHTSPNEYIRNGKTLKEYCEIIKEVCDFYSIPVLDMYSECCLMPFIDEQRNLYFQETSGAVHPNSEGAKIMARRVVAGLRSIVG